MSILKRITNLENEAKNQTVDHTTDIKKINETLKSLQESIDTINEELVEMKKKIVESETSD